MRYSSERRDTRYPSPLRAPLEDAALICGIRVGFIGWNQVRPLTYQKMFLLTNYVFFSSQIAAPTPPYTSDNDYTRNFRNPCPLRRPAPPSPHFPIPASISRVVSLICSILDSLWPLRTPLEDAALICGIRVGFIGWNQVRPPHISENVPIN
jgi:hypothetical protein